MSDLKNILRELSEHPAYETGNLLWEASRQISRLLQTHEYLDSLGVPKEDLMGTLSVIGRIKAMQELGIEID